MRKAMFSPIEEDKGEQRLEGTQTLETDLGLNLEFTIGFSQLKVIETNFSRVIQKGASLGHRAWVCSQNRQRAAPGTRRRGHPEEPACSFGLIWRKSLPSAKAATSAQQQAGFPKETEASFINLTDMIQVQVINLDSLASLP